MSRLLSPAMAYTMQPADAQLQAVLHHGVVTIPIERERRAALIQTVLAGAESIVADTTLTAHFAEDIVGHDERGEKKDSGVMFRHDDEHKIVIHVCREDPRWAQAPANLQPFVGACFELMGNARARAVSFAQLLDLELAKCADPPPLLSPKFMHGWEMLRILIYLEQSAGRVDAKMHLDRGGLTDHMGATHPGLVLIAPDGTKRMLPEETDWGMEALFPSIKLGALLRGRIPQLEGTPHGVVDLRQPIGEREKRCTVVCFSHPQLDEADVTWLLANQERLKQQAAQYA